MLGRLHALWLLALVLVLTLLKRGLGLGKRGTAWFHRNYAADGLAPLSAAEREHLARFNGCIACGLCDRGEDERILASRGEYEGLMSFVLAASRSMPDYGVASQAVQWVPQSVIEAKERICPASVPIGDLAAFVTSKANKARISLPVSSR